MSRKNVSKVVGVCCFGEKDEFIATRIIMRIGEERCKVSNMLSDTFVK